MEVGFSYGISLAEELGDGENELDLISKADKRLYRAKDAKNPAYSLAGEG
jgi:hypothetical protein